MERDLLRRRRGLRGLRFLLSLGFAGLRPAVPGEGLQALERRVAPVPREELAARALLDDAAALDDEDPVRRAHRREPVRDRERRAPAEHLLERGVEARLGRGVDARRRLVEEEDHGMRAVPLL